jgi:hypothetical protein
MQSLGIISPCGSTSPLADAPSDVQKLLKREVSTATKLDALMTKVTDATWRHVGAAMETAA